MTEACAWDGTAPERGPESKINQKQLSVAAAVAAAVDAMVTVE